MRKITRLSLMIATSAVLLTIASCSKTCDAGYEGSDCKTQIREKFIGQFKGPETCTAGTDNYTVTISNSSSSDLLAIILSNVYNQSFTATGTVSGTTLTTTANQTLGVGVTLVSGTGSISGSPSVLTFTYAIKDSAGTTNTCTFTGTKL
ncbi:MAG: hypothetical protein JWO06_3270 [Bacteroidota bacterium]|nr:hypothetical protein [Bacteroidota bacterium]